MAKNRAVPVLLGGMIALGAYLPTVDAARIDAYRDILLRNSYTIKYDNITPSPRVTNRDKVEFFGKSGMAVEQNDYLTNRQKSGIIVGDGSDRYEEVGDGNFNMCRLTKGSENFYFTKYKKNGSYEYFGAKKNKVEANAKNYLAEIIDGQSYGDPDVTRLLNAMLPVGEKNTGVGYDYVAEGTLAGGMAYEDYKRSMDGVTSVVRYYFNGESLVKIASADYYRKPDGTIDGHKCIIKITGFSPVPDKSLLKLPDGVEDITKRKGKEKAP